LSFTSNATLLDLHSFPTRRSSDLEKVFRESGLVTRATNTLKLLRQRQFAIFGTSGLALLLLLVFAWFGHRKLSRGVTDEAAFWRSEEHTSELQSRENLVCRLLLEK